MSCGYRPPRAGRCGVSYQDPHLRDRGGGGGGVAVGTQQEGGVCSSLQSRPGPMGGHFGIRGQPQERGTSQPC